MVVTLGQQYDVGGKPTVILYTYIDHHAEPPDIIVFPQTGGFSGLDVCVFSSHPFWTSSSLDVPAGVTQEEDAF